METTTRLQPRTKPQRDALPYAKLSAGGFDAVSDAADTLKEDDQDDVSDDEQDDDNEEEDGDEDDGDDDGDDADDRAMESRDSLWDSETPLPPLPNAHDRRSLVELLTNELAADDSHSAEPPYLETFEVEIPDSEVVLGAVPVEEVESRERELEDARIRHAQLEAEAYRARETRLAQKESIVKDRLVQEAQRQHDALVRREKQLAELAALRARRIRVLYQQCETHLLNVLREQQAVVSRVYGDFAASRVPESLRRLRVAWRGVPQTLAVRVKRLNAVKDKLPRGNYVLVATLYDRLGGHAMHWTNWDPEGPSDRRDHSRNGLQRAKRRRRPNFTRPFLHRGRFFHTDVVVDQRLDVVCPPESARRPANAIVFELFRLADAVEASDTPHKRRRRRARGVAEVADAVVGWGVLPMCMPDLALVSGKFKVPMLRGELDATMDKFRDVEHMYARDLSAWLCNLYVQTSVKDELAGFHGHQESGEAGYDVQVDAQRVLYDSRPSKLVENGFGRYVRRVSADLTVAGAGNRDGRSIRRRKKSADAGTTSTIDDCTGACDRQAEASAATTLTTTTEDEHDLDGHLNGHRGSRRRRRGDDKWWSPTRWLARGKGSTRVYVRWLALGDEPRY